MTNYPLAWVLLGVAGSGKSTVGRMWSQQLECDFLEGDRRHSAHNISKMASHIALQDVERQQWLLSIQTDIGHAIKNNLETVITCSALKQDYRNQLRSLGRVQLVWLDVDRSELERRLTQRSNHYMGSELLPSQLATFEPLQPHENAIILNGILPPSDIVANLLNQSLQLFPDLSKPWWRRQLKGTSKNRPCRDFLIEAAQAGT